ncbi:MAG: hypothetical protein GY726_10180 [Proteobacteria bacterium]|nr:hypothetical protein [Pseudomonadota bacterium]
MRSSPAHQGQGTATTFTPVIDRYDADTAGYSKRWIGICFQQLQERKLLMLILRRQSRV